MRRDYLHGEQVLPKSPGAYISTPHDNMGIEENEGAQKGMLTLLLCGGACRAQPSRSTGCSSTVTSRNPMVLALQSTLLLLICEACKLECRCYLQCGNLLPEDEPNI